MTEFKRPDRRTARDIAREYRESAEAAIARLEQTQTLTEHEKKFIVAHALEHAKYDRNAYNEACDNVINLQLTDRAEFLTEFDEPSLTAEMQMWAANFVLTKTVKKGRDARPSRNPFAEPSVRKHKR